MFGKNDDLVDQNYQASASPQAAAQDMSFGSAGGDFMSAAPLPADAPRNQIPAAEPAPTLDVPVQEAAPQSAEPQPYAPPAQEETHVPESMSFSARFGNRTAPAAQTPEPVSADLGTAPQGEIPSLPAGFHTQPVPVTTPTYEQPLDVAAIVNGSAEQEATRAHGGEMQAFETAPAIAEQSYSPDPQTAALEHAAAAVADSNLADASGKARIQAAAITTLVNASLEGNDAAKSQLSAHGFEMFEKLADNLPPASDTLNAVVEATAELMNNGLVSPIDGKAQQNNALEIIAQGMSQQGMAAAYAQNSAMQAAAQQQAAQAERTRPKSHAEIVESARIANEYDAERGVNGAYL